MTSYLSQLRKLKLSQGESSRTPSGSISLPKDNDKVLRDIANFASGNGSENELQGFLRLVSKEFDWSNASEQEVCQCEAALIDYAVSNSSIVPTLVQQLLPQFRDPNSSESKIQLCDMVFDNVQDLKKRLRQILIEAQLNTELQGRDLDLFLAVLKFHPLHGSYIDEVDGVFVTTHPNPNYRNLRCSSFRKKDGSTVYISYTICADFVRKRNSRYTEAIRHVIAEICRLYPRAIGIVAESIESVFPHYNIAIEQHVSVTLSLLYLARRVQRLRPAIYRLIFKKMTIIDAEIKRGNQLVIPEERLQYLHSESMKEVARRLNAGDMDLSEAKSLMENTECFKEIMGDGQTEEDLDSMTHKLDRIMLLMMEELRDVLTTNMDTPVNETSVGRSQHAGQRDYNHSSDSDDDSDLDGSLYESSTGASDISDVKQEPMYTYPSSKGGMIASCGRYTPSNRIHRLKTEVQKNSQSVTVSDLIITELFDVFEDIILPTLKCKYVQFVYMYIISFKISWTHLFLQRMLLILYDEEAHSMHRKSAASYIASMVSRASFIQGPLVCSTVYYLFSMLGKFDYLLSGYPDSASSSVTSDVTPRSRNRFGESAFSKSVTKLGRFYSLLQDILHIVCYHAGTLAESPRCLCYLQECANSVCAYLESPQQPLGRLRQTVVEEAIKATAMVPKLKKLHLCLVRGKETLVSDEKSINRIPTLNSVDAWFPFDSFPLFHCGELINEKYRDTTYYDLQKAHGVEHVKQEPKEDMIQDEHSIRRNQGYLQKPDSTNYAIKISGSTKVPLLGSVYSESTGNIQEFYTTSTENNSISRGKKLGLYEIKSESAYSSQECSMFSLQDTILKSCPTISEEGGAYYKCDDGAQSLGESSSGSLTGGIKAKLYEKQRKLRRSHIADVEPDYDFWGFNYVPEGSHTSDSDKEMSQSGSYKRIKLEEGRSDTEGSVLKQLSLWADTATSRYESSDNSNLIVIGIDQLDDFELSLSSSILVNAPRRSSSRVLDILTSTEAYKSAIINSEVTKNKHKQSKKNETSF